MGLAQAEANRNADNFIENLLSKISALENRVAELESDEGTPEVTLRFPERATLWHIESNILVGNSMFTFLDGSQYYNNFSRQDTGANNDQFSNSFFLKAGSYTFTVLGILGSAGPKIDWYIDNVLVVSGQDWYATGPTYNTRKTSTVTVVGDGRHVLKGVVNGKNASSAGYNLNLTNMWFKPATDTSDV